MEVAEKNNTFFNFKGILSEASKTLKYDIKPKNKEEIYCVANDSFLKLF